MYFDHGLDFISKNGGYVLITVSANAQQAHLDHGDPADFAVLNGGGCAPVETSVVSACISEVSPYNPDQRSSFAPVIFNPDLQEFYGETDSLYANITFDSNSNLFSLNFFLGPYAPSSATSPEWNYEIVDDGDGNSYLDVDPGSLFYNQYSRKLFRVFPSCSL